MFSARCFSSPLHSSEVHCFFDLALKLDYWDGSRTGIHCLSIFIFCWLEESRKNLTHKDDIQYGRQGKRERRELEDDFPEDLV